jgi:hypothetical protein
VLTAAVGCDAQTDSRRILSHPDHGQPIYEVVFADSASDDTLAIVKLMVNYLFRDQQELSVQQRYSPVWLSTPEGFHIGDDYLKRFGNDVRGAAGHENPNKGWPMSVGLPTWIAKDKVAVDVSSGGSMMLTVSKYELRRLRGYWHLYSRQVIGYS